MKALDGAAQEPHIFILDINGEYEKAFPSGETTVRQPDRVYLYPPFLRCVPGFLRPEIVPCERTGQHRAAPSLWAGLPTTIMMPPTASPPLEASSPM
ncbi:hypothetical protein [Paracoccus mutanolyticus]